jgi:hypothetical protein
MSHEIPPLEYLIFRGNTSGLKAGLQSDPNMTELKLSKKSGKPSFPQTLGGNAQNQTAALLNAIA